MERITFYTSNTQECNKLEEELRDNNVPFRTFVDTSGIYMEPAIGCSEGLIEGYRNISRYLQKIIFKNNGSLESRSA